MFNYKLINRRRYKMLNLIRLLIGIACSINLSAIAAPDPQTLLANSDRARGGGCRVLSGK